MLMNDYLLYGIVAVVVAIILAFIFLKVIKNKQPRQVSAANIPVDVDKIMDAVGGRSNIKETIATSSKVTFLINDDNLVDLDKLKEIGASGIVQTTNKVSAILGKYSKEISNIINNK